ncbi:MAG: tetratricopeptide repeat protein, partial [Synechococcales bacterium]|nr:tetratricopeptide repeat protein [Synechococcales bacterium]
RPVNEPDRFFDREELLDVIADSLSQNAPVILLHGQRRIGKSSILAHIPYAMGNEAYTFVPLSLEGKSQRTLPELLHEMAQETLQALELQAWEPLIPSVAELTQDSTLFASRFLRQVYEACDRKDLVLLLDEFDTLGNFHPAAAATHLFPYLSEVIQDYPFLHIIPVVGRRLEDLPTLLGLFKGAPTQEISLLDRASAKKLITEPAKGVLDYSEEAISAILDLCAGHPYFTQVICFAVFTQARQEDRWFVSAEDVYQVADRAIELGEGGLAWFWDGLPIPERVVYAAAAEIAQRSSTGVEVKDGEPLELLEDWGIVLTDCLHKAQANLIEWKFLKRIKVAQSPETVSRGTYRITIELVRRWLIRQHGIRNEIWELQDLTPDLKALYEKGREWRNQGALTQAIQCYERIYSENPNYLGALFDLAECYLTTKAYARALALYDRAYHVDTLRAREGLLRSGCGQAKTLMARQQLAEAETILERLLEVEPDAPEVRSLLADLTEQKNKPATKEKSWGRFIPTWKWNPFRNDPPAQP